MSRVRIKRKIPRLTEQTGLDLDHLATVSIQGLVYGNLVGCRPFVDKSTQSGIYTEQSARELQRREVRVKVNLWPWLAGLTCLFYDSGWRMLSALGRIRVIRANFVPLSYGLDRVSRSGHRLCGDHCMRQAEINCPDSLARLSDCNFYLGDDHTSRSFWCTRHTVVSAVCGRCRHETHVHVGRICSPKPGNDSRRC